MISLATGIDYVDLNFLGYPNIIATAVLHGPGGVALIDPGPSTSLTTLRSTLERSGIRIADVRQILLTHIHLDHAGCTGTLVKENPSIDVFVHSSGRDASRGSNEAALERDALVTARTWTGCGESSCPFPASGSAN